MHGIDAVGWQNQGRRVEIRGRETKFTAHPIARGHAAGNGVRSSEHLTRGIKIAGADGFANARAADDLIVERHGGQSVNGETQFVPEFFKQRDIAAALVAENKIRAHAQALDFSEVAGQSADERLAGLPAERAIEMNQQQRVRAQRFNRAQFLRQRINQRRHAVGRDHDAGVPVERDHQRNGVVLTRVGDGLADDLLMTEVDAVKNADGQANLAVAVAKFICTVNDVHRGNCSGISEECRIIFRWRRSAESPLRGHDPAASFKNGITLFSNSAAVNFNTSSSFVASATSNLPETLRRSADKCAPQPSFWPSSCAMLRT